MANRPITMTKLRQILRLHSEGKSKSEIATLTGAARNTVKRYLRIYYREQLTVEAVEMMNNHQLSMLFCLEHAAEVSVQFQQLEPLFPEIEKQLKRKGATRTRIWREFYLKQQPDGFKFTQFSRYLNLYLKRMPVTMHIEHKAGDKMYVDFAGQKLSITDKDTGEVIDVETFVSILGGSQLVYVEMLRSQTKEDLIRGCENALHYYGGVPAAIVPDNLKSAVTKSSKYEPTLNETFEDFALHYHTTVLPARSYRPRDKALVEGMVKIVYQRIYAALHGNFFFTLEELNQSVQPLLEELNNSLMSGKNYSRRENFEQSERAVLQPLPHHRYELRKQRWATVLKNGHVHLHDNKNYYSVPYTYMGKKVKLLYNDRVVDIYYRFECIATHTRSFKPYSYQTQPEHLASSHRFVSDWSIEKFVAEGNLLHADVGNYLHEVIASKQHPEQAYKSCMGILHLHRKVGKERLIKACRRAQDYHVFGYAHILNILDKRLDEINEEERPAEQAPPPHHNLRGSNYYN